MNEPTRGELGKARRALKKLGELNPSEVRLKETVVYLRAKGIDLIAHGSSYLANFLKKTWLGFSPASPSNEPSEKRRGNKYVRHGDPETSFEAQAGLDIKGDEIEALEYFERYYTERGITRDEFEELVTSDKIGQNWNSQKAKRRAKSLRRRLTGLKKKRRIELRYDAEGKLRKRDKQEILFLVQIEIKVAA